MKTLILAGAAALALTACADGVQYVTLNQAAIQARIEAMTGLPPAEQCGIYLMAKEYASPELRAQAEAIIEGQGFTCVPPAPE